MNVNSLNLLAGITPPVASKIECTWQIEYKRHLLSGHIVAPRRLKSQKKILSTTQALDETLTVTQTKL